MAQVASRTVRVTDIPAAVNKRDFLQYAQQFSSKTFSGLFSSSAQGDSNPVITFSPQFDGHIGTITLPSEKHKKAALRNKQGEWRIDDLFDGITVLYCPETPDIDICAIHGLNGNAFDTWLSESHSRTTMWLRDLLPASMPFEKARIMTFGYSSQLSDRRNLSGINEWSHQLLENLTNIRSLDEERKRPILFICYSMGGIVARQAMIRLGEYGDKPAYQGVSLKSCGLLFLGTPHSGSKDADWNQTLLNIAQIASGIRPEILAHLRTFNPFSTESQDQFANLKPRPVFDAFHETLMTKVGVFKRHIVTRQSASLNDIIASPMEKVDHHTICRFDGKFGGFIQVVAKLRDLKSLLIDKVKDPIPESKKPWLPTPMPSNCLLPEGKRFFEGPKLHKRSKLKGRQRELGSLTSVIDSISKEENLAVAITGIGGIGKTAALVEIAHQQADQRNVFFIHANDKNSLEKVYLDIARRVGPEYLMKEFMGRDIEVIWRNETPEGKIERFANWLNDPENEDTLLLLDDIDGIKGLEERASALPREAKNILYSTRDPVFADVGSRLRKKFRIPPLETNEILEIMEDIRDQEMSGRLDSEKNSDLYHRETLLQIAETVCGHPLAAANAIKYIVRVISQNKASIAGAQFVAKFQSGQVEGRRRFLNFSPDVPSIMDTFCVSQNRLRQPEGEAWRLLQFHGMLETESSTGFDPRDFFFDHSCPITAEDFPDSDILGAESFHLMELFSEIETVSFGERLAFSEPMAIHPLWLECIRHAMGPDGQLRCARQIFRVCYYTINNDNTTISVNTKEQTAKSFLVHANRCLKVCRSFKINLDDLNLPEPIKLWVEHLTESHER